MTVVWHRRAAIGLLPCLGAMAVPLAACSKPKPSVVQAPQAPPLTQTDVAEIARAVSGLRGLAAKTPITVQQLDEQRFFAQLLSGPPEANGQKSPGPSLTSFAEPDARAGDADRVLRAARSSIMGFYEGDSGKIYLKSSAAASRKERMMERLTVAHEVEHALQAQHFSSIHTERVPDEDARLARLALIEGDADITGLAYLSWEQNIRVERPIAEILRRVYNTPTEQLLGPEDTAILRLSPIDRERLLFPYVAGDGLAAALHRTGGFELVNRAFARPPETTEQVLHPERYVAGEREVEVPLPELPPGYTLIGTGQMGELQTRALLLGCMDFVRAARAAEGWGGDTFVVASSPQGNRALLWATAWDTEADATEFESALSVSTSCIPSWAGGASPNGGTFVVRRSGTNVALVRGLSPEEAPKTANRLLSQPNARPPLDPPFGAVSLRPLPPDVGHTPGFFQGAVYTSTWLGISGLLPPNYAARMGTDGLELTIDGPGAAGGMLFVSDRIVTPQSTQALFNDVATVFSRKSRYELVEVETGPYRIPLGDVMLRKWNVKYTTMSLEVAILPICGGAGAVAFLRTWASQYDKAILDAWFLSFRAVAAQAPVCTSLVP